MWLARAVDGEGGSYGDVIWTYLQRLALRPFRGWTLARLVQGHSQAISPDWLADGRFCRPGGSSAGHDVCTPARIARRAANRAKTWNDLSSATKAAITALDRGTLPNNIQRSVDFATRELVDRYVANHPGSQALPCRANCFLAYAESVAWPDNFVTITPGGSNMLVWGVGIGAAAVAVGAGWLIWKNS